MTTTFSGQRPQKRLTYKNNPYPVPAAVDYTYEGPAHQVSESIARYLRAVVHLAKLLNKPPTLGDICRYFGTPQHLSFRVINKLQALQTADLVRGCPPGYLPTDEGLRVVTLPWVPKRSTRRVPGPLDSLTRPQRRLLISTYHETALAPLTSRELAEALGTPITVAYRLDDQLTQLRAIGWVNSVSTTNKASLDNRLWSIPETRRKLVEKHLEAEQ